MIVMVRNEGSGKEVLESDFTKYCLLLLIWPWMVTQFFCESLSSSGIVVYNNNNTLLKVLLTGVNEKETTCKFPTTGTDIK